MMSIEHFIERERLSPARCLELLESYGTPDHVVAHCIEVARVAVLFGRALKNKGCPLDLELIESAALLHDMARVRDRHWDVTADLLEGMGHTREASIIRTHMHHPFPEEGTCPTESDLVCLADRVVLEDHYVGLDERMAYVLAKAGNNQEIKQKIMDAKLSVGKFIEHLEEVSGVEIGVIAMGKANQNEPD